MPFDQKDRIWTYFWNIMRRD